MTSIMRVGQRPSIKAEPVTSCMLPAERPSGEANAADIASDPDSVIGAHPSVDRSSAGEHETDYVLTEPRQASRTPSEYRASTETGAEETVPVMNTIAGGPTVDRTSTGMRETIVLTPASVAEEPRGDPAMVETILTWIFCYRCWSQHYCLAHPRLGSINSRSPCYGVHCDTSVRTEYVLTVQPT